MRAEKQVVIDELKTKIEAAAALIFTSYTGASAEQMGALRGLLDELNGGYMVVKNRLFARAASAAGLDGELPGFAGQVGVAFSDEESSMPVLKALVEFKKQHDVMLLLGGFVGGRSCTAEQLKELARLPSKPVMRAQVLSMLQAVPRGMVSVLAGRLRSLLYLINAYVEKRGGVPEEAPAVQDQPAAEEQAAAEERPVAEEQAAAEKQPVAEERPAVEEQPVTEEQAAPEDQPAADEQPAAQDEPPTGDAPADAESKEPDGQGGSE